MSELVNSSCEACRVDSPRVVDSETESYLRELPQWKIADISGVVQLKRCFTFKNFVEAMAFSVAVGEVAEAESHHPAMLIEWGRVDISWWTHKIHGLHKNDFVMAAKTDAIYCDN
mgnify:CR=1 FL=1